MRKVDREKEVTIKLKMPRFCAEQMMGALRLGLTVESMCADMVMCSLQSFDTHSMKYGSNIAWIIKQIGKQTKLTRKHEDYGYAYDEPMEVLMKFSSEEAKKGEKAYFKWEREEHKRIKEIEKKLKQKLGRKPTTDEVIEVLDKGVKK